MKLHIGGMEKKEGWKILNIQKNDGKEKNVDFVGDISDLSQFDDGSIEEVYASHTLEHVNQKDIRKTIEGIYRVLKDDGKFYVSVPDMDILCKIFLDPKPPVGIKYEVMRMIYGGQRVILDGLSVTRTLFMLHSLKDVQQYYLKENLLALLMLVPFGK